MKQCNRFVLCLILLLTASARADLNGDIRFLLGDKLLAKGDSGVEVIRLGNSADAGQTVFEYKSTTPRIPASNFKLLMTAAAVEKLGADFQFKTVLAGRNGDVALIGDGDPSFGDAEMLHKVGWEVNTVFKNWADNLKQRGITQVHDVLVDDSIFDQNFTNPDWPIDQLHKRYVAQVAGVNLNVNCLDFYLSTAGAGRAVMFRTDPPTSYAMIRNTCVAGNKNAVWLSRTPGGNEIVLRGETNVGNDLPISVTINDPPMYAATVLAETFAASGIKITGLVKRDLTVRAALNGGPTTNPADAWTPLAEHSTPLAAVIERADKDSINLYAEALCKRIGAAASGQSGSWENGHAAISTMLDSIGVSKDEFALDDGCGLSKKDAISPHAIAAILRHEFFSPNHDAFVNSLAVGGVDGTFKNRFTEGDLRGRVFGKSGYVNNVSALSGYLKTKDDQWYVFSILMNNLPGGANGGAKELQEKIVRAIDNSANATSRVASGQ